MEERSKAAVTISSSPPPWAKTAPSGSMMREKPPYSVPSRSPQALHETTKSWFSIARAAVSVSQWYCRAAVHWAGRNMTCAPRSASVRHSSGKRTS